MSRGPRSGRFFRNFFAIGLKDNPFLGKGVLTGILRVSKENIFSGLNNLDVCSLTSSEFDSCFGLLENEVEELLNKVGILDRMPELRNWYNGYLFGKQNIHNPWSVISFAARPAEGCLPQWVNTSNNQLLGNALANGNGILHRELEDLLSGGTIEKAIDDKKYATELEAHGCAKTIKWAIAFRGKEVFLDMR